MSHFSVMVMGPDIAAQLQPFHEYECTGVKDQYVVEVDETDEARERYESDTEVRMRNLSDGTLYNRFTPKGDWDPAFSQPDPKPTHWDINRRVEFVPEGFERVEVPTKSVMTFAEFVQDHYSITLNDAGRVIDYTNPNKKWDWWMVGGRWTGFFTPKPGTISALGEGSLLDKAERIAASQAGRGDIIMKGDVDVKAMRDEATQKARQKWDQVMTIVAGRSIPDFEAVCAATAIDGKVDYDKAREVYHLDPVVVDFALPENRDILGFFYGFEPFLHKTFEQYVQDASDGAIAPYACIIGGKWYERGSMGWFGMASDEKDRGEWGREFNKMFDALPDDTMLTIVDCHI